jgi:hypothetical protein
VEAPQCQTYSGLLRHAVNQLSQSVLGTPLDPMFQHPRAHTGELIGVEYLYSQTSKALQDVKEEDEEEGEDQEEEDEGFASSREPVACVVRPPSCPALPPSSPVAVQQTRRTPRSTAEAARPTGQPTPAANCNPTRRAKDLSAAMLKRRRGNCHPSLYNG